MNIVILKPIVTITDVVTVKLYGTFPVKLAIIIKKNKVYIKIKSS